MLVGFLSALPVARPRRIPAGQSLAIIFPFGHCGMGQNWGTNGAAHFGMSLL